VFLQAHNLSVAAAGKLGLKFIAPLKIWSSRMYAWLNGLLLIVFLNQFTNPCSTGPDLNLLKLAQIPPFFWRIPAQYHFEELD